MLSNVTVYLFDVDSVQDPISGDRSRSILSFKKVLGELTEVGATTFWNAHTNNVELVATVQIQRQVYKKNKFVYYKKDGLSYALEVSNTAKGESFEKIRLNLSETKEPGVKEMIENAISG